MQVAILGPLEVRTDDGLVVEIAGGRLRTLITRLVLDAGRPVGAAQLVDAVWGPAPPADEVNALQTLVSRLRRALGDPGLIVATPGGYRLGLDPNAIDATRFERLARDGAAALHGGDPAGADEQLERGLALWRGPALAEAGEFAAPHAARLEELRLQARLDRGEAGLALGRAAAVAPELEALLADHPLNERVAGQWLTALAASGRPADAVAGYERIRANLADQLGVDPSAELQALHLRILRGELAPATPAPAPATARVEAAPVRRSNLRAQLTSFVGRDAEVARIAKSLEEFRLVTLVGPGGAGKTRLAIEATAGIVDDVPDGVWFVELASVTEAADLALTVLGSLGLRETHLLDRPTQLSSRDAQSRLVEGLADKRALIVLDNCEHLVEGSARLADTLLGQCPTLRVLATSREPLGIFGEFLLVVPPLGAPGRPAAGAAGAGAAEALDYPAVRLFADRAATVRPDFVIDDESVGTVVEIVRRLDGLPLAIELAAARLRTLPLPEIGRRLSDRFRLLTGGSRTALPRHRTLRAVVEWSWELLSEPERRLAERMAVFPAGAELEAAEVVCTDEQVPAEDVAELLASLVDKSLLQPVKGRTRLRMLETIREFGLERVAERGELPALRRRHADYYAGLMRTAEPHLIRREQLDWLAVVSAERDNLLAALRFRCDTGDATGALEIAVSMSGLAMLLGNHTDVASWIAEALEVPGDPDPGLHAIGEALFLLNSAVQDLGRPNDEVAANVRRLGEIVEPLEQVSLADYPFVGLVKPAVAMFAGDAERLHAFTEEALNGPDPWLAAAVLMFRASIAENDGDVEQMRVDATESLARFRALGERWGLGGALRMMGMVHTLEGDLDAAAEELTEAMQLMHEMGSREDETQLLVRLADLAVRQNQLDRGRELLAAAQASSENGSPLEAAFMLGSRADLERLLGELGPARALLDQALARVTGMSSAHPMHGHAGAIVHTVAVKLALAEDDLDAAAEHAVTAYAAAVATKDFPIISTVGLAVARWAERLGRAELAAEMFGAADALRGSPDPTAVDAVELQGGLLAALGAAGFDLAYQQGRRLARPQALLRIDPASVPTRDDQVPQGSRDPQGT